MQSMLERAKRDDKVLINAAREIKKPSGKRKGSVFVVSPEKVEQIRAKFDAEGKAIVAVLAYSGMRPGELLSLRWSDIGKQTLRVEQGTDPDGTTKETKTGAHRSVVLLAPLAADLEAWRKSANGSPRPLCSPRTVAPGRRAIGAIGASESSLRLRATPAYRSGARMTFATASPLYGCTRASATFKWPLG
jgi:integrase